MAATFEPQPLGHVMLYSTVAETQLNLCVSRSTARLHWPPEYPPDIGPLCRKDSNRLPTSAVVRALPMARRASASIRSSCFRYASRSASSRTPDASSAPPRPAAFFASRPAWASRSNCSSSREWNCGSTASAGRAGQRGSHLRRIVAEWIAFIRIAGPRDACGNEREPQGEDGSGKCREADRTIVCAKHGQIRQASSEKRMIPASDSNT